MPRLGPGSGGGGESETLPAMRTILALRSFKRQTAKGSGNEYLRCRWEVCTGKFERKAFFSNMSLDLSKEGTVNRWRILMEACGVDEEFELGSRKEGTEGEGDENIRRLFLKRPFVATIKVEINGQYRNNDIELIHYKRTWTAEEVEEIERWLDAQENAGQPAPSEGTDDTPPGPSDRWDDDPEPLPIGKPGGFAGEGDDDIPF